MKYKVGEIVSIKTWKELENIKNIKINIDGFEKDGICFTLEMKEYCGKNIILGRRYRSINNSECYLTNGYYWHPWMFDDSKIKWNLISKTLDKN